MKKIILISLFGLLIQSTPALAYLSVNETAEVLPENYFSLGVAPQFYLSNGGGFDLGVMADAHIADSLDGRIAIGSGKIDFWTMASLKWVPFPDVDSQPAMGIRGAVGFAREDNLSIYQIQVTPMLSKRSNTSSGDMIPYVAVPFTYMTSDNESFLATQFALGAQWYPWKDIYFGAEFDLNLENSVSSGSVYFMFPFESGTGYKKY